jgi:hypothetical protein
MIRPEVRIVQSQEVETTETNVSQSEADALLAKYGYKQQYASPQTELQDPNANLTFDEMIRRQEAQEAESRARLERQRNGAQPVSFDPYNMNYSETKYTNLEVDNTNTFGIKVQIVSDMKIPK